MPEIAAPHTAEAPAIKKQRSAWRYALWLLLAVPLLVIGIGLATFFSISAEERSRLMRDQAVALFSSVLPPAYKVQIEMLSFELSGVYPALSLSGVMLQESDRGAQIKFDHVKMELDASALWRFTISPISLKFDKVEIIAPLAPEAVETASHLTIIRDGLAALAFALSPKQEQTASLRVIEANHISLLQRPKNGALLTLFEKGTLAIGRQNDGSILAHLGHEAMAEKLVFTAKPAEVPSNHHAYRIEAVGLDVKSISSFIRAPVPALSQDMKVEAGLFLMLSEPHTLLNAEMRIAFVGGEITLPDPDVPPFGIKIIELIAGLVPEDPTIAIRRLSVQLGETDLRANGRVITKADGYHVFLAAEKAEIDRPSPEEPIVSLEGVQVKGRLAAHLKTFTLDKLTFAHGSGKAEVTGVFSLEDGGRIDTNVTAQAMDLRAALRVWPISVAPPIRRWMLEHTQSGRITNLALRSSLAGKALQDAFSHRPIPDDALDIQVQIEAASLTPIRDAAQVREAHLTAKISGRHAAVQLSSAHILPKPEKPLKLTNAQFTIADTSLKPAVLDMNIPVSGSISGFLAFFEAPSLRPYLSNLPPDISLQEGQLEGRAKVALKLVEKPSAADAKVDFTANLTHVMIDNIVKDEKLEAGTFQLSDKGGILLLRGEARFSGIPAQIELRGEPNEPVEASLKLNLDDAQRSKRGIDAKSYLTGPIGVTLTTQLQTAKVGAMKVELDLTRAKVEGLVPGILKRAGQPASAKFRLTQNPENTLIEGLEAEIGAIQAKGMLEFGKDQQLQKADFASLKFSPGDNIRLQAEKNRNIVKLTVRGNSFDIRPFLRGFQVGKIDDQKSQDIDLDIQTTVLVGFAGEIISAADIQVARRNGRLTRLSMKGNFGSNPLIVTSRNPGAEPLSISVETGDAGALLRFMEFYPRMFGGRLNAEIDILADKQGGFVQIRDFMLRGEPALQQFAAAGSSLSAEETRSIPAAPLNNPNEVSFTKLRADFSRRPGRLELSEAVMWGPAVGGSLEGYLDYAKDNVDLKGTLVPAYALNNLFSQVPLFGLLLGGTQYEGLFAMPFLINGKASSPVLRVNPLSVIAPGFLRKIFEIQREDKKSE